MPAKKWLPLGLSGALSLASLSLGQAGEAGAQVSPGAGGTPLRHTLSRSPLTQPYVTRQVLLSAASLRHPMNVYREVTLDDRLLGQRVTLRTYTLDGLLRRTFKQPELLAQQGYVLSLQTRSGGRVRVPLSSVYGRGGLLAFAEKGEEEWKRLPGAETNPHSIYLIWPDGAPQPELSGLWDVIRLTLLSPQP